MPDKKPKQKKKKPVPVKEPATQRVVTPRVVEEPAKGKKSAGTGTKKKKK